MEIPPNAIGSYDDVISDLELKLSRLEEERDRILDILLALKDYTQDHRPKAPTATIALTKRAPEFSGLSLIAAIKHYLEKAGTPQSFGEIVAGLENGGYSTTSKNLIGLVRPAVYRHVRKASGEEDAIIKIGDRWGLAKWKNEWRGESQRPIPHPLMDTESALAL